MPTPNDNKPEDRKLEIFERPHERSEQPIDASQGYETTDVGVPGVVVFIFSLAIFVVVTALFCYGMGKVINSQLAKADGPATKWNTEVETKTLGNLATNPEMQNRIAQLTSKFPTPRLQTDDGNQDIADLHEREDLLLEHYSRIDKAEGGKGQGEVRIPIERAMELIAERGLPVAAPSAKTPLLAEDKAPVVTAPLTNGFARTGYEQEMRARQEAEGKRPAEQR